MGKNVVRTIYIKRHFLTLERSSGCKQWCKGSLTPVPFSRFTSQNRRKNIDRYRTQTASRVVSTPGRVLLHLLSDQPIKKYRIVENAFFSSFFFFLIKATKRWQEQLGSVRNASFDRSLFCSSRAAHPVPLLPLFPLVTLFHPCSPFLPLLPLVHPVPLAEYYNAHSTTSKLLFLLIRSL